MVQRRAIKLQHIRTNDQVVDIRTKPLGKVKFLTFRERIGVVERPSYEGPIWDGCWAVGAPRGLGTSWSDEWP